MYVHTYIRMFSLCIQPYACECGGVCCICHCVLVLPTCTIYRPSCGCEGCGWVLLHPLQSANSLRGAEDRSKGHGRGGWATSSREEGGLTRETVVLYCMRFVMVPCKWVSFWVYVRAISVQYRVRTYTVCTYVVTYVPWEHMLSCMYVRMYVCTV